MARVVPDTQRMLKSLGWPALLAFALIGNTLAGKTPFPEFTGKRLYVSGVQDVYQPLVAQIEQLEQESPQTYYVVVVESSGEGQFATRDYLDDLYQAWLAQAARKGLAIDPNRSVLVLLAQQNRQISVKPGTLLQSQYGLRDQTLDRELVQKHFIPHAKAGNYAAGVEALLKEIDKTIAAKDAQVERTKQEAIARALELQKQSEDSLKAAETAAQQLQQSIEAQRRKELATEPISARLEQTWAQLETARGTLMSQPEKSLAITQEASRQLAELKTEVEELPQLAQQAESRLASLATRRTAVGEQLAKAQQTGADTKAASARLAQLDAEIAAARELSQTNYKQALESLDQLDAALSAQQQEIASAQKLRHFLTRTAPISAASLAALAGVAGVGGLQWRHVRLKRKIGEQLSAFRAEVTQWMERLDALKKRHQYLPFTDEDFTGPMTGQTLALYNEVQASYDKLRATWLVLMDRRTKADGVFALEGPLGVSRLQQVEEILAGREDTTQLQPLYQDCVEKLDRLNQAHEEAEKSQQDVEAVQAALADQLQRLAAARLSVELPEEEIAAEREAFEQAVGILRSDPLFARGTLESVHERLKATSERCQRRLDCVDRWRSAESRIAEAAQRATELRAGGLKLREESADPDSHLEQARGRLAEGWTALERAETETAEALVEQAQQLAAEVRQRVEQHLADKEFSAQQLPKLRGELADLHRRLDQAESQRQELAADFHPESWSLLAENVPQAAGLIDALAGSLDEADEAASDETQHYSRAAHCLREAEAQRQHAAALLEAVAQSLAELQRQRTLAATRHTEVMELARRVAAFLNQHDRIVGRESQRNWSHAQEAISQADAGSQQPQPHWPHVLADWEEAAVGLSAALELAERDVRDHEQLLGELSQVRSRAANVGQLLRSHTADRPRANQRHQGAVESLEQIAQASAQPNAAWSGLLAQLKQASADVTQAHEWAEEDIRLAEQAAAALQSAEAEYHRTRTFVRYGVSAPFELAESQIAQARQRLQAQDYEQAIALADSAERVARQAHLDAIREAEERRRRLEEERRRREMQRMAAAAAAAMANTASRSASAGGFSSGSLSRGSTSSHGSWSSGTSQSGW